MLVTPKLGLGLLSVCQQVKCIQSWGKLEEQEMTMLIYLILVIEKGDES